MHWRSNFCSLHHISAYMRALNARSDFMYESMEKTTKMLHYLYPLLGKRDQSLRHFMEQSVPIALSRGVFSVLHLRHHNK